MEATQFLPQSLHRVVALVETGLEQGMLLVAVDLVVVLVRLELVLETEQLIKDSMVEQKHGQAIVLEMVAVAVALVL
jgi:hypothetical protein